MNFTDLRLRVGRFIKNNRKILLIVILVWIMLFMINNWIKNRPTSTVPETSYEAHTSVMSSTSTVPSSLQVEYEDLIAQYVEYCNEGEFNLAYIYLFGNTTKNSKFTTNLDETIENDQTYKIHLKKETETIYTTTVPSQSISLLE